MKILALDLGKSKTVSCEFSTDGGAHSFRTIEWGGFTSRGGARPDRRAPARACRL